MNQQETITLDAMKAKAGVMVAFLEKSGQPVKRTLALETVAQMYGYPNWSTARAAARKRELTSLASPATPADGLQGFDITVLRVGYGHKTLEVWSTSYAKAREEALDTAGDFEFSEKTSEYFIEGKEQLPLEDRLLERIELTEGPVERYQVDVCRMSFSSQTRTYRARTLEEAEARALDDAGNHYFEEDSASYVVSGISSKPVMRYTPK